MTHRKPEPGVGQRNRSTADGLARLAIHLERGERISDMVLRQWIRRYGDDARELLRRHDRYHDSLEP